jgi:RNA polymerase sigma-70 factor (ECF subfamily)
MDPHCSDAELVRHISTAGNGAPQAEALLYQRFAARIELYGRRHLGLSAAQDLVQQVILRVLVAIRAGRLREPEALASFVLGTCRNVSWDARRAERRQTAVALGEELSAQVPEGNADAPEQRWLEQSEVVRLFRCMGGLPEREASVVRMSFWEDQSAEEIGERVGASAGNVRVIRHRALAKLQSCMQAQEAS